MTNRPIFYLKDYKPTEYLIPKIDLFFYLEPEHTKVISKLHIKKANENIAPLALNGENFELLNIKLNNIELDKSRYNVTNELLIIQNIDEQEFILEITTLVNPLANKQLMGLYISNDIFCTQCEAEGFRNITYFYDRPDVLSIYSVYIEANKLNYPILLSNGNKIKSGDLDNSKHYAMWHDPFPKPCYLFALVAGDLQAIYDEFITIDKQKVDLAIYTEPNKSSRAIYAMDALKRSMAWDEQKFGRKYDLDLFNIVAVSDFNAGAMENKGLNIFNDKFILCDKDTATDADFAGVERVIAHEYFHNWTGNRITCRDWFQLCLKEGLTVYRDQEFCAGVRSAEVQRINDVRHLIISQFSVDKSPLSHAVRPEEYSEINNFYTTTIYKKGAELIRMLETMFGAKIFREAMDLYFVRHDGQACTMEDYIACFEDVSGKNLEQFMLWYSQSGTPHVTVETAFENNKLTIKFKQSLAKEQNKETPKSMVIPIKYGLIAKDGSELKEDLFILTQAEQSLTIDNLTEEPFISLNRKFSAPITIEHINAQDNINLFLAKYDKDAVNRFMSLQKLFIKELKLIIDNNVQNYKPNLELVNILKDIAADETLEPSLRALYLSIPSEGEIAQTYEKNRNPQAISNARTYLLKLIAQQNGETFKQLVNTYPPAIQYSPNSAEIGKRSLFLTALLYYSLYTNSCKDILEQYKKTDNLTIRFSCLVYLAHYFNEEPQTKELLEDFYKLYQDTPLVLDKWFALQASIANSNTVEKVKELINHPKFDLKNPNRIYALLGTFVFNNLVAFNAPDGSGYKFISELIMKIDSYNPQVSGRLLSAFGNWKAYSTESQNQAKIALNNINNDKFKSTDIADLIVRLLK